jgi:hypothetical protein
MTAQTKKTSSKKLTIKRGSKPKHAPLPPPAPTPLDRPGRDERDGIEASLPPAPKPETLEEIIARVSAAGPKLFKVLVEGHGTHRPMMYSLPKTDAPGDWHEVKGTLELCHNGLHLTSYPAAWWKTGAKVYLAEVDGETIGDHTTGDRKCAARKVRLLREATTAELAAGGILDGGTHEIDGKSHDPRFFVQAFNSAQVTASGSAKVTAYDSAQVTASGSAKVTAYDSAKVTASGSAQVTAYDSAKVTAYDSAKVTASGSAQVTASGSAKVTAYDSAQVTASGSAKVTAYDSAKVTAYDSAQVTASGSAKVTAYDSAQVTAYDSAKVTAYDSAQVTAFNSAKVTADQHVVVTVQVTYYNKPGIKLQGHAVAVEYTWGSAPKIRCASQATLVIDPAPAADAASGKAA